VIIVKGARNKDGRRAADYAKAAVGETDQYGNPFRMIKLRWTKNRLHRNGPYAKTRGFEDTIITVNTGTGEIAVSYRPNGSVMWDRGPLGVGPFFGELGKTAANMTRLAKCYRDGLWTIVDSDIDGEVKAMSDKHWLGMSDEDRAFNEERIRRMHILPAEDLENNTSPIKHGKDRDEDLVKEKTQIVNRREMELQEREAKLAERERTLMSREADIAETGTPIGTGYTAEAMGHMKMHEVRKIARETYKMVCQPNMTRADIIDQIIERQLTGKQKEFETVTG